jgi:glucarate dehydratase
VLSVADSIRVGRAIAGLNNDYLEDPTWGLNGMRRVREAVDLPLATNTVVIDFEQLATNLRDPAVDVVLLDTTFWGGIRPCVKAAGVCETFQADVAVHSSGELGIQLATMLHLGAVLPNLTYAADAHYHHLVDDILVGGKLEYRDGCIAVPDGPGLGVTVDEDKLRTYAELFVELGSYPYDRDPGRPGWFATTPATAFADPSRPGPPA